MSNQKSLRSSESNQNVSTESLRSLQNDQIPPRSYPKSDNLKVNENYEAFWGTMMKSIPLMFSSPQYTTFHVQIKDEHLKLVQDQILLCADMFGFTSENVKPNLYMFCRNTKTVVISLQDKSELNRNMEWRQIYKPYVSKYGVFSTLNTKSLHKIIYSEIKPFVLDNRDLPFIHVAVYDQTKTVVGWFIADPQAEAIIKDNNLYFVYQNGRPYCSKLKKYAVELFFERNEDEQFVPINSFNDLRFRSIGVGDFGVKFLASRDTKVERSSLATPVYALSIENYYVEYTKGFRHENEDIAMTIDTDELIY